jgi:RND family efflux transporter MFP subunit
MTSLWNPLATIRLAAAAAAVLLLAACNRGADSSAAPPRPVQVVAVEATRVANDVQLSGEIQAEKSVALAFRIGGRIAERSVNVGDRITAGQVVARLEPETEQNAVRAAKASLDATRGELTTARNAFDRQAQLMAQGFTTRPRYDQAFQAQQTAEARLENAEAQLELAKDRLGFTVLKSDVDGVVTARSAEPGEVVQAGQLIVQVARDDGRDAVFSVPAQLLEVDAGDATIRVALADDPAVVASGTVREVSPKADPVTRTFEVRVGLRNPPEAMRLGSTVKGLLEISSPATLAAPASALTQAGASPAVWVVDPSTSTVSLRPVDILRFESDRVVLSQGLEPGEIIVTGGIQALHPGQRVQMLPAQPDRRAARSVFAGRVEAAVVQRHGHERVRA